MKLPSLQNWSTAIPEIQPEEPVPLAPLETVVSEPRLTDADCLKIAKAFLDREANQTFHVDRFVCPYSDWPRWINAHVCKWHRDKHDPECIRVDCLRVIDPNEKKRREGRQVSKQSSPADEDQLSLLFSFDAMDNADID